MLFLRGLGGLKWNRRVKYDLSLLMGIGGDIGVCYMAKATTCLVPSTYFSMLEAGILTSC
jgi:hypothetical protein